MAGYLHVEDRDVTQSLQISVAVYIDELINAFAPYSVKILRLITKPVYTMLWLIPQNSDYAVRSKPVQ